MTLLNGAADTSDQMQEDRFDFPIIPLGYSPVEAIELVRCARGRHALSNHRFAAWLLLECTPRGLRARSLA